MLQSSNNIIVKAAVQSFVGMVKHEGFAAVSMSLRGEAFISRLIGLLKSDDADCVQSASRVLASITNEEDLEFAIEQGLFSHIPRLMKSPNASGTVANCSILLRQILEHRSGTPDPFVEPVLDAKLVPRLAELAQRKRPSTTQINSAQAMSYLAGGTKYIRRLGTEDGFLSAVVNLIEFREDIGVSVRVLRALGWLVPFWDMLEYGIVPRLLRVLNSASQHRGQLKAASKAFAECCRGRLQKPRKRHFDFHKAKAGLKVATKLIEESETDTRINCCWALHNILEGLDEKEMSAVLDIGFVKRLVDFLDEGLKEAYEPALKSLHIVSAAGEKFVRSIIDYGGALCLMGPLTLGTGDNKRVASDIIGNIIVVNSSCVQTLIDSKATPCLLQMLSSESAAIQSSALQTVYQAIKRGTATQVKSLVDHGCIKSICASLDGDYGNAIVAIGALTNVS